MPYLRRLIAVFQIYGGIAGGFVTLSNILNTQLVGINAVLGFLALMFYVIAVIAGVLLLECREIGRKLSLVVQAISIPLLFIGSFHYIMICGAIYAIKVGSKINGFIATDWAITSRWSIAFSNTEPFTVGVNVLALLAFILLGFKSIVKYK